MAYYLQMNGSGDYLKLPSMTLTRIVFDGKIRRRTDFARIVWDFRSGIGFSYLQQTTGGVDNWGSGSVKVDTVTKTNTTVAIPDDTRCIIEHTLSSGMDDGNIFSNNSANANTFISGDIYDIKIYNGTTLMAWYDMTLGNVQDQSGNGRHATLTGGTWVSDSTSVTGSANLQGMGTLTASGVASISGSASLQGVGALTGSGIASITGSASLQGTSTLTATGTATGSTITGSVSLQGTGTLAATGAMAIKGSALLTGTGTLTASGGYPISGSASLVGVGTLTASGVAGTAHISIVNLYASRELTVYLNATQEATINLYASMEQTVALRGEI